MADRFCASIYFPKKHLDDDIKHVIQHVCSVDEYNFDDEKIVFVCEYEAQGGEIEELETILQEKNIPYDRENDAYYEYPPEVFYFRPATKTTEEMKIKETTTHDYEEFVLKNMLRDALSLHNDIDLRRAIEEMSKPVAPPLEEYIDET